MRGFRQREDISESASVVSHTFTTPTSSRASWFHSTYGSLSSTGSPTELSTVSDAFSVSLNGITPSTGVIPPSIHHWKSPYATIPLPPLHRVSPILHRTLQPSEQSTIIWDIRAPLKTARLDSRDSPINWLHCYASLPAQQSLTIRTAFTTKPIVVFSREPYSAVKIGDVLHAVHIAYQEEHPSSPARRQEHSGRVAEFLFGTDFDHDRTSGGDVRTSDVRVRGSPAEVDAQTIKAQQPVAWGGLVESPTEKEVWILILL